ncbi:MAG TPA: helix-turn-helix domain-containing protein [Clostridia bacterium]|nr:helix-turn-helix domain-containing protein [Clostridia bacterium]
MPKDQYMLKALEYIDKNITRNVSLYDISREAGFSVPHFYRLFRRLTGDTVGAYILRRRMAMAARELLESTRAITCIAYEYGFESHDVFTRAFTRVYGMSPNKYRHSNGLPPLKRLAVINDESAVNNNQMKYSLLHSDGFYVIGMECNARTWDSDGEIGRLWSSFLMRADEIKQITAPMTMYGICEHETCDNDRFRYMAAIGANAASEAPEGMEKRFIRVQNFIQANVPESISTPDAYSGTIGYAMSLGYEIDSYDNIEIYDEVFLDPDIHSFKLLIPIK